MKNPKLSNYIYLMGCLFCLLAGLSSCKKWLDVNSKTEIISEQHFNDISGFRDALVGVYVKMARPECYSMEATWRTVEFLAQQYAEIPGAPDLNVPKYQWETSPLPTKRETIWLGAYNTISNINQILHYQELNRQVFNKYPITDSLIRGEMLALRAFVHFDILRLYGKGNLGSRPELQSQLTVPYVTTFSKYQTPQKSNKETFDLLLKDIEEAILLLEADPLSRKNPSSHYLQEQGNNFINTSSTGTDNPNRKIRMNYWAAKALYARILLWMGTKESKTKALQAALEVIGNTAKSNNLGEGDGAYYDWIKADDLAAPNWYENDLAFVNEQLFTLNVENFETVQNNGGSGWFYAGSGNTNYSVVYLTDDRRKLIFEAGTNLIDADWRATRSLMADGPTLNNWCIAKLFNNGYMSLKYARRMPLIRVTEMYYIAAECLVSLGTDLQKAIALLNKVRNQRNIPASFDLPSNLTEAQIREEIKKEYMKEFIGEGQLFYYFKRLGITNMPGSPVEMTDKQYQMPIPDAEITNGGIRID